MHLRLAQGGDLLLAQGGYLLLALQDVGVDTVADGDSGASLDTSPRIALAVFDAGGGQDTSGAFAAAYRIGGRRPAAMFTGRRPAVTFAGSEPAQ